MTVVYREAGADDLPAIDRVYRDSFCDTFAYLYQPQDLAAFLDSFTAESWGAELGDPRFRFRVAEVGGEIAGFVKLGPAALPVTTAKRAIELRQLYVLKPYHGSGIARELTDWAIAEARRLGFEELYLTVFIDNHRARRFYDNYGFEEIGPYRFMVGNHADEDFIMKLAL